MGSSQFAGLGRLRALSLSFLSKDKLAELARAKDTSEIAQQLESTWYGQEIEAAAAQHKPPELIEIALNRHLININRIAIQAVPLSGKAALLAYLSKWDIENIELILAAKSLGKGLEETEAFLVSSRNLPVGLSFNTIPLSELQVLLQQPDVEAVINYLVKYGYGAILLQQLGDFRKSGDLGVFTGALQNYYFSKLLWELRFLKGDEGVLREYFKSEISKRDILAFLKSRESKLDRDIFAKHLIEGGLVPSSGLLEAYASSDITEMVKKFEPWFDLTAPLERYVKNGNLTEFEVAIDKMIVEKYLPRFRSLPISLTAVFGFVIQAEVERQNVRRITYAKQYGMTEEYIKSVILAA
ncbi:MAG: V-type ATPase subunit [Thaumarchaeota archaeon]|nr:V-type ATPase subunit [Nitrososphaerota archaeon]